MIVIKFARNVYLTELITTMTQNGFNQLINKIMQYTNQTISELTVSDLIRITKIVMSPSIQRIESILFHKLNQHS